MSTNKKYYFLKFKEDFFRDETIILLEDCKDGFLFSNILLKMYLLSLKHEGQLLLSQGIAYTPQMIATLTNHQVGTVEKALQIFMRLGLVEELMDGTLFMSNIQSLIGKSSTEGERKQRERSKFKEKQLLPTSDDTEKGGHLSALCPKVSENRPPEIRDKSIENRDKRLESESIDYAPSIFYGQYHNVSLSDKELEKLKTEFPTHYEKYIERLSEYMASTGKEYKSHLATIRKWAKEDNKKNAGKTAPTRNYDYQGEDSL
ncbi:MAG: phage replisome organizer N-terminal domain-containing protein [Brevinema sp.]